MTIFLFFFHLNTTLCIIPHLGVYRFNFTQPGTYYYTSSDEFLMTGIIEVKAFDDCMTEVIVETNYSTAIHTNIPGMKLLFHNCFVTLK